MVLMRMSRAELGRFGEDMATAHVESLGWQVIERNWRCRAGEIDIVAQDGRTIVVVEVKTRTSEDYGTPAEAVTAGKLIRLRRLAGLWVGEHRGTGGPLRIDVVAILVPSDGRTRLDHLTGVTR